MNIWKILGIAPTVDKKAIKKAYAAQSRECHPEEKPEEFRQLYEAYQAALEYAKRNSTKPGSREAEDSRGQDSFHGQETSRNQEILHRQEASPAPEDLRRREASPVPEDLRRRETSPVPEDLHREASRELLSYFAASQARQQELLDTFFRHWEDTQSPYHNAPVLAWWQDYLASEDFQSIRKNPELVKFLSENINRRFYYGSNEIKLLFWDAYGFREEEDESKYPNDLQKLRKCLHETIEHQEKERSNARRQLAYEKKQRFYKRLLVAGILFFCLLIPLDSLYKQEGGRKYLIRYMTQQYPGTEFSQPKKAEKLSHGKIRYTLHSLSHPDLPVTADVTYRERDRSYQVSENYSPLLLKHYAGQYGLSCGRTESGYSWNEQQCGVLYYPDLNQLHDFCETVARMFQEHEELTHLTPVGFCGENLLFPDVLLQGGVYSFSFPKSQFYEPWTMDSTELEAQIREAYITYLFLYEAWNLTLPQYEQWGPIYEKQCENWTNYKGSWYNVTSQSMLLQDPSEYHAGNQSELLQIPSEHRAGNQSEAEVDDMSEFERASLEYSMLYNKTGDVLCRIYLPVYSYVDSYTQFGDYYLPGYARNMTVGCAWHYLVGQGADVAVNEDGSGFSVRFRGKVSLWGNTPAVDFDELENWY